jgi:UDP:flavonoid glycosyltransferase YjiC (YdhE family)
MVSHGGNNSVTEALTAAVPSLVLPLSTDQFAGAAALEAAGYAEVLDPNAASPEEIGDAVLRLLGLDGTARRRLDDLGAHLTATPGPVRAREALLPASATVSRSSP